MKSNLKITIVDYHMSNLYSVKNACDHAGAQSVITSGKTEIVKSDAVILPGVGAFNEAMSNLKKLDLISPIKDFIASGKPFMGICLGMQLLFSESEEFGDTKGLDIINGRVTKFKDGLLNGKKMKIPHMRWSRIYKPAGRNSNLWQNSALKSIDENEYMYFVHSFYTVPERREDILAMTDYEGTEFCSSVLKENIFATQFHPEKSAYRGIEIYSEWIAMANDLKGEK